MLLNKLRDKYTSKKIEEGVQTGEGDNKGSSQQQGTGTAVKVKDPDKLKALQDELQQIGQPGEVQSLEDGNKGPNKLGAGAKDPNYYGGNKDGEEFHQGEVLEVGGVAPMLGEEKPNNNNNHDTPHGSVIAVLVFVCNRPSIKRNLDQLFKYRPSADKFPIIVSQDCGSHPATTSVIQAYEDKIIHIKVTYVNKTFIQFTHFYNLFLN